MSSPLSGTLTPAGAARTEIQGIGVQSVPIGWFTRSNFGGRFSSMLKFAGWDGIVIQGQADEPVWLDIRNRTVNIRNCSRLWGLCRSVPLYSQPTAGCAGREVRRRFKSPKV
jgi:aldehyde:ferredoxin oxidoreductase